MNVPKDQGLFFTVFFVTALSAVLFTWILLPPHRAPEGEEATEVRRVPKREKAVYQAEADLNQAETIIAELEIKIKEKKKEDEKKEK